MPDETPFQLTELMASGRLALHYQPRVHSEGQFLVGAEALLRWSPDGKRWQGVRALEGFNADDFALLWSWKLDRLAEAFSSLARPGCPDCGESPFFISLNLSPKQLSTDRWAREVLEWLEHTGIPGACLEIELVEEDGAHDEALTACAFERLRSAGVAIALDDFPEGSASMLRLAQYRFDKVKIDRAMVPQMTDTAVLWQKKRRILAGLITLISSQGARAVIEGVEQDAQFTFLSALDVDEWQGFLWGTAIPIDQLVAHRSRCDSRFRSRQGNVLLEPAAAG